MESGLKRRLGSWLNGLNGLRLPESKAVKAMTMNSRVVVVKMFCAFWR